jgi:hypothetical protein
MSQASRDDLLRLLDALERFYAFYPADGDEARRVLCETTRWLDATGSDDPGAFENVCARLGFDAARIRASLRRRASERRKAAEPHD